jgi:hypothetical protein
MADFNPLSGFDQSAFLRLDLRQTLAYLNSGGILIQQKDVARKNNRGGVMDKKPVVEVFFDYI